MLSDNVLIINVYFYDSNIQSFKVKFIRSKKNENVIISRGF